MARNGFRQDLYFRLNVASIKLPPLRERKDDIPLLIEHFAEKFSGEFGRDIAGFTDEAMDLLKENDWPGNIRELMNLIERIFIDPPMGKINVSDLPESMQSRSLLNREPVPKERELLLYTLSQTNWNKSQAAERLHWSRMTLYRKMAKYHIQGSTPELQRSLASGSSRNNLAAHVTKV
jgi:two-component system response regulator HydG/two-component system response regulator AtoC